MAALKDFTPLRAESIDSIRARIDAGTNAGLVPGDPRWRDTVPGGFFYDHTQAVALEAELLWDYASVELPASVFLQYSWGIYLDYWGELLDVPRKAPAKATGVVSFTNGSAVSTLVGTGSRVAAPANDPLEEPLTFATTADATVAPGATVDLAMEAEQAGTAYNVSAAAVTEVLSALPGFTVTNAAAMSGGTEDEADEGYKARLLLEFSASRGGGTRDDYIAEGLKQPSVGHIVVEPRWAGNGTVRLIFTDPDNNPLSTPALAELQDHFDPVGSSGNGDGWAPINHVVTVATVAVVVVPVAVDVTTETGYSIVDTAGQVNVTPKVQAAVSDYVNGLAPGEDVQRSRVLAAALAVDGVHEVAFATITLSGSAADKVIAALEVAEAGTVTVT